MSLLSRSILAAVLLSSTSMLGATVAQADEGRIVLQHRVGLDAGERAELRSDAGVRLTSPLSIDGVEVVQAEGSTARSLAELRQDPDVLWAQRDGLMGMAAAPTINDSLLDDQWGLRNTGQYDGVVDSDTDADEAWAASTGAGVTVGVVDTGVQVSHPDLSGKLTGGYNVITGASDATNVEDDNGHGTHVSGVIAARHDNQGIAGMAPGSLLTPFKALKADGQGYMSDIAVAFDMAGDQGLRVVSASIGGSSSSIAQMQAIADHPNTLYVVAAGNSHSNVDSLPLYPCAYDLANVLCVGATDREDELSYFSSYGAASVDIMAPGSEIVSTYTGSSWAAMNGTSMATPAVAAAAALVAQQHPSWSGAQVKARILSTGDPVPALSGKSVSGARLNAARAVGVTVDPDGVAPVAPGAMQVAGDAINWSASSSSDVAAYRLYRWEGGAWALHQTVGAGIRTLTPTGLQAGVHYTFRMRAVDVSGNESALSSEVYVDGPVAAPVVTPTPATVTPTVSAPVNVPVLTITAPAPTATIAPARPVYTPVTPPATTTVTVVPQASVVATPRQAATREDVALPISAVKVTSRGGAATAHSFRLQAAGAVRVSAQKRSGGKLGRASVKTLKLRAGTQTVALRTIGRLSRGTWVLTLRQGKSAQQVTVRVK